MYPSIYYAHNVENNPDKDIENITLKPCQLRHFLAKKIEEEGDAIPITSICKQRDKGFVLTFDDGFKSVYENVHPICKSLGVPYCIFITTGYISNSFPDIYDKTEFVTNWLPFVSKYYAKKGIKYVGLPLAKQIVSASSNRYMDWEHIIELNESDLVTIGGHSVNHMIHTLNSKRKIKNEIIQCKSIIEDNLGINATVYSYPFGLFNLRALRIVRNAGYEYAFTTELARFSSKKEYEQYMIRRQSIEKLY
jgi:peptidoglycan/xylan/chitin deacetylase (PgdA/CDA1 family)